MSNVFWSIILSVGAAGWISSTIVFIFKAFPERDRCEMRSAMPWLFATCLSFLVWIAGMLNA